MLSNKTLSQRGFTMVELLTVLVIIGVLMTISLVAYNRVSDKARLARVKSNVGEIVLSLDNFARDHAGNYPALTLYHNNLPPSGSISATNPPPPSDPTPGVPMVLRRMGNAIVGGSPALADNRNPLQDDFVRDVDLTTVSFFRERPGEIPDPSNGPMHPVDQLILNGDFDAYPENPLAGPGIAMVNVAYLMYDYDSQTNDFTWVTMSINAVGEDRTGLCAARPFREGVYEPIPIIWDEQTYPQGDFAYIPFNLTSEQGTFCEGYWIICYGDVNTLVNSPYNKYALDQFLNPMDPAYANWPNFPPPYGDGNPNTPPVIGTIEYEIKRMIQGALDIRATIFEDQLTQTGN